MLMKVMRSLSEGALDKPSNICIGVFDGVHLGHRYLVGKVLESARTTGHLSGVVTFDRRPSELLAPHREILYLTTLEEKLDLLGKLGVDFVAALPFTRELADTTARDFIAALVERLRMKELWTGPDFALGRDREGNADYIQGLADELGFENHRLPPLEHSGRVISSTRIRNLIREGRVDDAADILGRYPSLKGEVVRGARRGHKLGFPTANVALDERLITPANGVYAARIVWDGVNHTAVVNIGRRPTFEDQAQIILEAHVLDFTGDLYGKTVQVDFVKRLRPEQRFESADALIAQMETDVTNTRLALDGL